MSDNDRLEKLRNKLRILRNCTSFLQGIDDIRASDAEYYVECIKYLKGLEKIVLSNMQGEFPYSPEDIKEEVKKD